jgi:predicted TPR repeat methyltransferase
MTRDPLACGDLIASRRYAYAMAAAAEGDWGAAREVLEQALERAPDWAPAWFALGEARQKLGDIKGAAEAFRAALARDPADAQGAAARLALIGRGETPSALPEAYVARLFDDYAPRFDAHLTDNLFYRGPALIAEAIEAAAPGRRFASALDIGCGTGLMGEALGGKVDRLIGVDLSPRMIAKARERGLYQALELGDAADLLSRRPPAEFDLVVAADSLVYFGDLEPVFRATTSALSPGGLFAFSVETWEGDGFRLGASVRFAHARNYLERTAVAVGLRRLRIDEASTRREEGRDAPGLVCVFAH